MMEAEFCNCDKIHEEYVKLGIDQQISDNLALSVAEIFKVFGDATRVKILHLLTQHEMCVCDIAEVLQMTQSAISHQLRVLKQARLVKYRREGKVVFYSLDDDHVYTILTQGIDHVIHL